MASSRLGLSGRMLSFDDVLKESIDNLKDEDEVVKNKRGREEWLEKKQ